MGHKLKIPYSVFNFKVYINCRLMDALRDVEAKVAGSSARSRRQNSFLDVENFVLNDFIMRVLPPSEIHSPPPPVARRR
jgi:hypothetical protein